MSASGVSPKWLIDLHGIVEALTTKSNSARTAVINAIESGEMLVLRSVSDELKNTYPHLWAQFSAISPRKYLRPGVPTIKGAAQLMESYGASFFGSVPNLKHFEAVAAAKHEGITLVSGGDGLSNCQKISKKCGLPATIVADISKV